MSIIIYLLIIFFGFLIINHIYETFIGEKTFEGLETNVGVIIGNNAEIIKDITPKFEEQLKKAAALVSKIKSSKEGDTARKKLKVAGIGQEGLENEGCSTFEKQNKKNILNMGKLNTIINKINDQIKTICETPNVKCSTAHFFSAPIIKNSSNLIDSAQINAKIMIEYNKKLKNITNALKNLKPSVDALNKENEKAKNKNEAKMDKIKLLSKHSLKK